MTYVKKSWGVVERLLPVITICAFVISITSFALIIQNSAAQTAHLRNTMCGFVEPIGNLGPIVAMPQNPAAFDFKDQLAEINKGAKETRAKLGCTPDPFDHK